MQGQRAVHSSLLSLNHDQRFNRNGHLDKGRFRPHRNLIQIPTKCDLAKRESLGSNNLDPTRVKQSR